MDLTRFGHVTLVANIGASLALMGCGAELSAPDLPMDGPALEVFRKHSDWKQRKDLGFDPRQAAPSRIQQFATSVNVGDVKVIEGDSTNVSTVTSPQSGYALRMDQSRQDLSRITRQLIEEEGDHFDFVVVFPSFEDLANPGFAYFSTIKNQDMGIGLDQLDQSDFYGSAGRLQGFLNMNRPEAYRQVDGREITDLSSAVYPIMGQELTHRWLAFGLVRKPGFQGGQTSNALLGRDDAHWSALMHTGPADMTGEIYSSVQDGVAWVDNGNGTFTAADVFSDPNFSISQRSRFSTLDMYLMGLSAKEEVEPFFVIDGATYNGRAVSATSVVSQGATVQGTRVDFNVDHVIAALGARVPDVTASQKDFNVAIVVVTQPGETAAQAAEMVDQVEIFRQQWELKFAQWTGGRASVCTALNGNCSTARVALQNVQVTGLVDDGVLTPDETFRVTATVKNLGSLASDPAGVVLTSAEGAQVDPASLSLGSLAAGASVPVEFSVVPPPTQQCGAALQFTLTLTVGEVRPQAVTVERVLGVRTLTRESLETVPNWTINPGSTDTAPRGRWALGRAYQTDLRRYGASEIIMQPGEDASPDGEKAYFTGPGNSGLSPTDVGDTDVDDGVTTLQTPLLNVAGLYDPIVKWSSWHTALVVDLEQGEVRNGVGDDLVTEVSQDGTNWIEVDRDDTSDFVWKEKSIRVHGVAGLENAQQLILRFTVGDVGAEQNVVEAGIDELVISDIVDGCPGSEPSASSSSSSSSSGAVGSSSGGVGGSGGTGPGTPGTPAQNCTCAAPGTSAVAWQGLLLLGAALVMRRRVSAPTQR